MMPGGLQISCISSLVNKGSEDDLSDTIFLLKGAPGSGKTVYCRAFIGDGLKKGGLCIYLNSSLTEKQFLGFFNDFSNVTENNLKFVNPYLKRSLMSDPEPSSGSGNAQLDSSMDPKLALT